MNSSWIGRVTLLAAAGILLFVPIAGQAQEPDYSRVVRLSRTDGQVLVSHDGGDTWEEALVNLPLQQGDSLATQGGFAETEFENGATAYLAENSVLQFTQLAFSGDGRVTQLNLTQGAGTFYANLTGQDSFRIVTPTFEVAIPERAEFRVDAFRDGASIQVLLGEVSVSTSGGSTTFQKGQSVAIHESDLENPSVARLPEPDGFDQWVSTQSDVIQSGTKDTLNYISSPSSYGLSDLSIYGSWVNLPGFGYSWRPFSAGFSWTPYLNGIWRLDPLLGWIWVSNEAWGWMPYHFGSWFLSPTLGWVWVPGAPSGLRQWEGARVNWVRAGNQVGWVAMSPKDHEGLPANLEHGVITRTPISARNRNGTNQLVAGKEFQSATPLKQPPPDFASHSAPREPRSGFASAAGTFPRKSRGNQTVVFDGNTHSFINGNRNPGPAAPAALLPSSNARTGLQQTRIPLTGPADSQSRHIVVPPATPVSRSMTLPNPANRPANIPSAPQAVRPAVSAQSPQTAPSRPASPAAPQQPHSASPPPASPRTNTR
jgi:hypothetical protein